MFQRKSTRIAVLEGRLGDAHDLIDELIDEATTAHRAADYYKGRYEQARDEFETEIVFGNPDPTKWDAAADIAAFEHYAPIDGHTIDTGSVVGGEIKIVEYATTQQLDELAAGVGEFVAQLDQAQQQTLRAFAEDLGKRLEGITSELARLDRAVDRLDEAIPEEPWTFAFDIEGHAEADAALIDYASRTQRYLAPEDLTNRSIEEKEGLLALWKQRDAETVPHILGARGYEPAPILEQVPGGYEFGPAAPFEGDLFFRPEAAFVGHPDGTIEAAPGYELGVAVVPAEEVEAFLLAAALLGIEIIGYEVL